MRGQDIPIIVLMEEVPYFPFNTVLRFQSEDVDKDFQDIIEKYKNFEIITLIQPKLGLVKKLLDYQDILDDPGSSVNIVIHSSNPDILKEYFVDLFTDYEEMNKYIMSFMRQGKYHGH